MIRLYINAERCKACGLCIAHCPKQLLQPSPEMNKAGYHPVVQAEPEKCTGCALCAVMCPDVCFTIHMVADAASAAEPADGPAEVAL